MTNAEQALVILAKIVYGEPREYVYISDDSDVPHITLDGSWYLTKEEIEFLRTLK